MQAWNSPATNARASSDESLLIRHQYSFCFDACYGSELAFSDGGPEFRDAAEVVVRRPTTEQFLPQVFAKHVGSILHKLGVKNRAQAARRYMEANAGDGA